MYTNNIKMNYLIIRRKLNINKIILKNTIHSISNMEK